MRHYTVVIVGPRGSGKTVFLGSMYRKIGIPGELGLYIEAGDQQRRELVAIYNKIATGEEWPNATVTTKEWKFKCRVLSPSMQSYTAFEISYYDYSGGRVTDPDKDDPDFQNIIDNSDCLLGLLDGQKIYNYMNNKDSGTFQFSDLPNILGILTKSSNPVHLVVSKWDILESHFTLEQIRTRLLEDMLFKSFVSTRSKNGVPVRLIPVSSVGNGFATWNSSGQMAKKLDRSPKPFQVEMPLALVLPDKVRAELNRLILQEEQKRSVEVPFNVKLSLWDKVGLFFGGAVRVVREYLPEKLQITEKLLRKIAERSELSAQQKKDRALKLAAAQRVSIEEELAKVRDEKSAFEFVLSRFENIELQLDYNFPASEITIPWQQNSAGHF